MKRVLDGEPEKRVSAPRHYKNPEAVQSILVNFLFGKYSPMKTYFEFNAQRDPGYLCALMLLCQQTRRVFAVTAIDLLIKWDKERDEAQLIAHASKWTVRVATLPLRVASPL